VTNGIIAITEESKWILKCYWKLRIWLKWRDGGRNLQHHHHHGWHRLHDMLIVMQWCHMSTWANLEYLPIQLMMELLQIVTGLLTTSTVVCKAMFTWYWWPYNQCSLHFVEQEVEIICTKTAACNEWIWSRLSNGIFWVADAHIWWKGIFSWAHSLVCWSHL